MVLLALTRTTGEPSADEMLAELERALARSGRTIAAGVTLAELERRFRTSPDAAAYIRTIRMARFAGDGRAPTTDERRALRTQLRAGLGIGGLLRGLWALPPRWRMPALRRPAAEQPRPAAEQLGPPAEHLVALPPARAHVYRPARSGQAARLGESSVGRRFRPEVASLGD